MNTSLMPIMFCHIFGQIECLSGSVCCAVQGHAVGILPLAQQHIGEHFYRASDTEHHVSQLSMGLLVVHEIVTLHRGTVNVASGEGPCIHRVLAAAAPVTMC